MKWFLIFTTLLVFLSTAAQSQENAKTEKCFPFGTSLIRAEVNKDGSKLLLTSVLYNQKVFDLRTGQMIAFAEQKDFEKVILPAFQSEKDKEKPRYSMRLKSIQEGNKQFYVNSELDSLGNIIFERKEIVATKFVLNERNGDLIIATSKTISLASPGKKERKITKAGKRPDGYSDAWYFVDGAEISPDGRYLVSGFGYITDLQKSTTLKNVFSVPGTNSGKERPSNITFNAENTTCTVSLHNLGLVTYALATGAAIDTVPIPDGVVNDVLSDIFEIIQIPGSKDFIYWLKFYNKAAAGGIAYYIKDGVRLNICDPGWIVESYVNQNNLIAEFNKRQEVEKELALEAKRKEEAYRKANPNAQNTNTASAAQKKWVRKTCGYCNGAGTVTYEKLIVGGNSVTSFTVDQYGTKTYKTTGQMVTKECSACRGKKYVENLE